MKNARRCSGSTLVLLSIAVCAWPARARGAAPSDPLVLGRQCTAWFYAGETDRIWQLSSPEMRKLLGSAEGLKAFRDGVVRQAGQETAVLAEKVRPTEAGAMLYERVSKFSAAASPWLLQWGLGQDGSVNRLLIQPAPQEAQSRFLDYRTTTVLRLPFTGAWSVVWGGRKVSDNYHAIASDQRFADDLVIRRDGATHSGDGSANAQYYAYGRPILAPAAGLVVEAVDGIDDNRPGEMDAAHPFGNHVVIDHGDGECSVLAHLQKGSVAVTKGTRVKAADPLGRCGNSGHSSEPHLHYHLQNTPRLLDSEGLPAQFTDILVDGHRSARHELLRGEVVENEPASLQRQPPTARPSGAQRTE